MFFFLSYFWINVGNINRDTIKNHFIFDPVQEQEETNRNFTACQVPHFMIVLIPYINLLNLTSIKKTEWLFAVDCK